MVQSSYFSTY